VPSLLQGCRCFDDFDCGHHVVEFDEFEHLVGKDCGGSGVVESGIILIGN
jgi:hypothetical protein